MNAKKINGLSPNRRQILQIGSAAAGAALLTRKGLALPQAGGNSTTPLVVVFMRGGADALGFAAPASDPAATSGQIVSDDHYVNQRPTISVPPPTSATDPRWVQTRTNLGTDQSGMALHPVATASFGSAPSLADLMAQGELAMAMGVSLECSMGACANLKSHFFAQSQVERGASVGNNLSSGWLGRYVNSLGGLGVNALAHSARLPESLRGASARSVAVPDVTDYLVPGADFTAIPFSASVETMNSNCGGALGNSTPPPEHCSVTSSSFVAQLSLDDIYPLSGPFVQSGLFPPTGFGRLMLRTAELLQFGPTAMPSLQLDTIFLNFPDDWDDHEQQGGFTGNFSDRLADLSRGLGAFFESMGGQQGASNYNLVVLSEFGRRVFENGTAGTDHGTGGVMLFMGKGIAQGQAAGKILWPSYRTFDPSNPTTTGLRSAGVLRNFNSDDEDLETDLDVRDLIGEVMVNALGMPLNQVFDANMGANAVFPGRSAPVFQGLV